MTEAGTDLQLGALRSTHRPGPLWRKLLPLAFVWCVLAMLGVSLLPQVGARAFIVVAPFALFAALLLGWTPLRNRNIRVDCHALGVVVITARKRTIVRFDDVDQVWLVLDRVKWVALIRAVQLVDQKNVRHRIPADLQGAVELVRWIVRQCSDPLVPEAKRALRAGEPLTFGKLTLDRTGIRGSSWQLLWQDIKLVRYTTGRISFFRNQTVFPRRTVALDRIPHPFVMLALVGECARKFEVDDPFAFLKQP
jgi:hypothetical protein